MIAGRGATNALSGLPAAGGLARALSDIPCVELPSSSSLILFVVASSGGVLVVVCAGFKTAAEDSDEAVGDRGLT